MNWSILSLTNSTPIRKFSSPNRLNNISIKFSTSTKLKPIMLFKGKMPNCNLQLFSNTGELMFISIIFTCLCKSGKLLINKLSLKTLSTLTLTNSVSIASVNFTSSSKKPPIKTPSNTITIKITQNSSTLHFIMLKNFYKIKITLKSHAYWLM